MSFIKVIIIFVLIYFSLRILFRYIVPLLLTWFINRKMKEFGNQAQQFYNQQHKRGKDGNVSFDFGQPSKKKFTKDKGEYVDFEEIKE